MKPKLTHRLWAKITAAVLLTVSLLAGTAAGIGVFACVEQRIYTKGNSYFESDLCLSEAGCLAGLMADIYWCNGAEDARAMLDQYSGQCNAYLRIVDEDTGEILAATEVPDAVRAAGLTDETYYRGANGFVENYVYDYEHDGPHTDQPSDFSVVVAVAAPLADLPFDDFYEGAQLFSLLRQWCYPLIAITAAALVLALTCLIFLFCAAGHRDGTEEIAVGPLERVPFDLLAAVFIALWCCAVGLMNQFSDTAMVITGFAAGYALGLPLLLTCAVRCKAGIIWKNTVLFRLWKLLLRGARAVGRAARGLYRALPLMWKAVLILLAIAVTEAILLGCLFAASGFFFLLFVLFDFLLLLAAFFGVWQMTLLQKAGKTLASGDFDHKLDTSKMFWEFRRHGENLNSIADGMAIAVEQRIKSERLKTELITNVSHDIKTPLTSIVNYVDLLQRPELSEETRAEYLSVLARQSQRLKKLTEDLVEASKASTGSISVALVPTDLAELVNQAAAEYSERLKAGRLEPVIRFSGEDLTVLADGRLLWRVLDNLLGNVCKYALAGTRVYLDAEPAGDSVRLCVKNISRDPLNVSAEELLERFVRGDKARSSEGSGLGLSIARSLTELQKGSFSLAVDGDLFKAEILLRKP